MSDPALPDHLINKKSIFELCEYGPIFLTLLEFYMLWLQIFISFLSFLALVFLT